MFFLLRHDVRRCARHARQKKAEALTWGGGGDLLPGGPSVMSGNILYCPNLYVGEGPGMP